MISPTDRRVLAVLAAAAYVSRTVWNGTADGSTSVAVMAGRHGR
jgi:hypothetical protein